MTDLKPVEELTFEEALEELEELTSSMASGEATLKESVAGYVCTQRLVSDQAEGTFACLRYTLGGDRPSQTTRQTLSFSGITGRS